MCKKTTVVSGDAAADMYVKYISLLQCEIRKGIFRLNIINMHAASGALKICIYLQCAVN
jgi:hypothetical protein